MKEKQIKKQTDNKKITGRKILGVIFFLPRLINNRIKFKITTKTTAMYALLYITIVIFVCVFAVEYLKINIKNQINTNLEQFSQKIIQEINSKGFAGIEEKIAFIDTDVVLADSNNNPVFSNTQRELRGDTGNEYIMDGDYMIKAVKFQYGGEEYILYVSRNIHNELLNVRNLATTFAIVVPVGLVIMVALGSLASKAMLNPIKQMNETIKSISAESLETRIQTDTAQDELDELKNLLNQMLDELESSFIEQTRFVSDASHELRTPIAVVQGYANLLKRWGKKDPKILDEAIEAISKESDNMKNMVDKLLFLAKADTLTVKREQFVLAEVLEEIVKETCLISKGNGIEEIYIDRVEPIEIIGDKDLIKQAVRIFVDNAVKYTDDNGVIRVSCYIEEESNVSIIKIVDNGIGIPAVDLPNIFERFYRCDTSRNRNKGSTGLGLSIAKWIIDSHGGKIVIESSENVGTTVFIRLPSCPPEEG